MVTVVGLNALAATSGPVDPAPSMDRLDPAQVQADRLIAESDCWTGEAPTGVVPGHAVVARPGGMPRLVSADVGFGVWLDGDPGTVYAFCL